jgi:rhodanese-related sulfurtransferase
MLQCQLLRQQIEAGLQLVTVNIFMSDFFSKAGIRREKILHLTPAETKAVCEKGALLVDVREDYMNDFKMFDVPEVIYCPYSQLKNAYDQLPRDKHLVFADAAGIYSKLAAAFLISKGFDQIANMAGGLIEWERDQLPLIVDKEERLSGSCMCQLRKRERKKN